MLSWSRDGTLILWTLAEAGPVTDEGQGETSAGATAAEDKDAEATVVHDDLEVEEIEDEDEDAAEGSDAEHSMKIETADDEDDDDEEIGFEMTSPTRTHMHTDKRAFEEAAGPAPPETAPEGDREPPEETTPVGSARAQEEVGESEAEEEAVFSKEVLRGHSRDVMGVVVSADERFAVSWSLDAQVLVWALDGSGRHCVLRGHSQAVEGVRLIHGGRKALSWGRDAITVLWDLSEWDRLPQLEDGSPGHGTGEIRRFEGHAAIIGGLEALVAPDGEGTNGSAGTGDTSADETHALSWDSQGHLVLNQLSGGKPAVLKGHSADISGVSLLRSGRLALSWGREGLLILWRLFPEPGLLRQFSAHSTGIRGVRLLDKQAYAVSWCLSKVALWSLAADSPADGAQDGHDREHSEPVLDFTVDYSMHIADVAIPAPSTVSSAGGLLIGCAQGSLVHFCGAPWETDAAPSQV